MFYFTFSLNNGNKAISPLYEARNEAEDAKVILSTCGIQTNQIVHVTNAYIRTLIAEALELEYHVETVL